MSGEPKTLTLTLEEAMRELEHRHMHLRRYVWSLSEPNDSWVVWGKPPELGEPGYDPDLYQVEVSRHEQWPEAVSAALGVRVVARDEAAELRAAVMEWDTSYAAVNDELDEDSSVEDFENRCARLRNAEAVLRRIAASEGQP